MKEKVSIHSQRLAHSLKVNISLQTLCRRYKSFLNTNISTTKKQQVAAAFHDVIDAFGLNGILYDTCTVYLTCIWQWIPVNVGSVNTCYIASKLHEEDTFCLARRIASWDVYVLNRGICNTCSLSNDEPLLEHEHVKHLGFLGSVVLVSKHKSSMSWFEVVQTVNFDWFYGIGNISRH